MSLFDYVYSAGSRLVGGMRAHPYLTLAALLLAMSDGAAAAGADITVLCEFGDVVIGYFDLREYPLRLDLSHTDICSGIATRNLSALFELYRSLGGLADEWTITSSRYLLEALGENWPDQWNLDGQRPNFFEPMIQADGNASIKFMIGGCVIYPLAP